MSWWGGCCALIWLVAAPAMAADAIASAEFNDRARQAPWQHGPAHIELAPGMEIDLPEGLMYLAPDYVAVLRGLAGGAATPEKNYAAGFAVIAREDLDAVVRVTSGGRHGIADDHTPPDPMAVLKSLNTVAVLMRGFDDDERSAGRRDWIQRPHWDAGRQSLRWAYTYLRVGYAGAGGATMRRRGYAGYARFAGDDGLYLQAVTDGVKAVAESRQALATIDTIVAGLTIDTARLDRRDARHYTQESEAALVSVDAGWLLLLAPLIVAGLLFILIYPAWRGRRSNRNRP